MKKQIIKLGLITFLLTTGLLSAGSIITLGKHTPTPVDEGEKNVPKKDRIKGATTVSVVFESKTLSLAKEDGKVHQIIIKKVSQAPLTCQVTRDGKTLDSVTKKQRFSLVFDINTTQLKVDDNITLSNKNDVVLLEILVKD